MAPVEYSPEFLHSEDMLSGQLQNLLMGIYGVFYGSTETLHCEIFRNQPGTGHVAYMLFVNQEGSKIENTSVATRTLYQLILGDGAQKQLLPLNLKIERLRNRRGK